MVAHKACSCKGVSHTKRQGENFVLLTPHNQVDRGIFDALLQHLSPPDGSHKEIETAVRDAA